VTAGLPPSVRVRRVQIRHSPETGTTLTGTRFGDSCRDVLRRGYLRGCWVWDRPTSRYIANNSVGQPYANHDVVIRTTTALRCIHVEVDTLIELPH
jgi:hypothetical protein